MFSQFLLPAWCGTSKITGAWRLSSLFLLQMLVQSIHFRIDSPAFRSCNLIRVTQKSCPVPSSLFSLEESGSEGCLNTESKIIPESTCFWAEEFCQSLCLTECVSYCSEWSHFLGFNLPTKLKNLVLWQHNRVDWTPWQVRSRRRVCKLLERLLKSLCVEETISIFGRHLLELTDR